MTPRIALLLGDRNGIGPELVARLLARPDLGRHARVVLVGDRGALAEGQRCAGLGVDAEAGGAAWDEGAAAETPETTPGQAGTKAGREMLAMLRRAARLATTGEIDGIVFAPLNKHAISLAEPDFRDELALLARELDHRGPCGELNVLDGLWTSRVTSHVPLAEVSAAITAARVLEAMRLVDGALRAAGHAAPRLAVSALNPHAGEGGLFGREEIETIAPAIAAARQRGIAADGPFPADTVFVRARGGAYDAVVSMYHDQGQIAMKLLGFGRGVTVLGGLPLPVTTPAHGTAYDIAGRGVAEAEALWQAFLLCCRLATGRRAG